MIYSPINQSINQYINQSINPFFQVLADWHGIMLDKLGVELVDTRRTPFLLTFPFDGVSFDLVAIRNNTHDEDFPDRDQMRNDLQEVKDTCNPLQVSS